MYTPTSGTHDVQNVTVVAIGDGIQIEGHYIDNSEAEGLLVIMYKVPDPVPQYHLIPRRKSGPKRRKFHCRLTGAGAGEWLISVFVVEKDRLPLSRVATSPKVVFIPKLSSEPNHWLTAWSHLTCVLFMHYR